MTDHEDLVRIDRPTLRADATLKLEASGYVAAELLNRINAAPSETLEVEGTVDDFEPFDFVELARFTHKGPNYDGWVWGPIGDETPPGVTFENGKTYAIVEILEDTETP